VTNTKDEKIASSDFKDESDTRNKILNIQASLKNET
jgi:hypothetical protein